MISLRISRDISDIVNKTLHFVKFSTSAMANQHDYTASPKGFATKAIHAFQDPEQWDSMAVIPPLVTATTFKQYGPGDFKKYNYGRIVNPNRETLENCLATLEGGKYGLCFASGVGAISTLLSSFKPGDHVICGYGVYGGTNVIFDQIFRSRGLEVTFVDQEDTEKSIKPNTKLIWMEGLTNPTMTVTDIPAIAKLAHKHNILFGVDNTFLTPYFQRPLEMGADIVMHSLTKYINGHSDLIMGAIITNKKEIYDRLFFLQTEMGNVPAPFDCYQVIRSLKTLTLRMKQHMTNSLQVAQFLENHPKVEKVLHPGLASHPQHDLFKKLSSGWSGMLSFYIKGGLEESKKFLSSLKYFVLAESLGGVESIAQIPALMAHALIPEEHRKHLKLSENFIRVSVGLEDIEDLINDLQQALDKV